jgi:hypothetical protein
MATKKKKPGKAADEGFLTTAAEAIGSTLGHFAKKAGDVLSVASAKPAKKKAAIKKKATVKKKAAIKKKK